MNTNNYFDQVNLKNQPEPSKFTQFLWWCAGADSYFMKQSPKQDRVKYSGIGGVVLATGVLASLSGFLAFKTAFGTKGETALDIAIEEKNRNIIDLLKNNSSEVFSPLHFPVNKGGKTKKKKNKQKINKRKKQKLSKKRK